jgi:hypothetical protein
VTRASGGADFAPIICQAAPEPTKLMQKELSVQFEVFDHPNVRIPANLGSRSAGTWARVPAHLGRLGAQRRVLTVGAKRRMDDQVLV